MVEECTSIPSIAGDVEIELLKKADAITHPLRLHSFVSGFGGFGEPVDEATSYAAALYQAFAHENPCGYRR